MGQYRLWISLLKGITFGIYYKWKAIWIYFLCFEIMIGLEKDSKGIYINMKGDDYIE